MRAELKKRNTNLWITHTYIECLRLLASCAVPQTQLCNPVFGQWLSLKYSLPILQSERPQESLTRWWQLLDVPCDPLPQGTIKAPVLQLEISTISYSCWLCCAHSRSGCSRNGSCHLTSHLAGFDLTNSGKWRLTEITAKLTWAP